MNKDKAIIEICKYCGSTELIYDCHLCDSFCSDCGFWQDEIYPKIRYLTHIWYVGYMLGQSKVMLSRVYWKSDLKRKGVVVRTMIAPLLDMPKKIQDILN